MRGLRLALVVLVTMAYSGCSSSASDGNVDDVAAVSTDAVVPTSTIGASPVPEPRPASVVPPGFDSIITLDGRTRTYRVVDLSDEGPAPLLVVLHGFGGTAQMMSDASGIDESFADRYDIHPIVVYPNGSGSEDGLPQSWNAGACCPFSTLGFVDDVAFFDQLIGELTESYDIDLRRIWVVGHSNGGMMAYRLACELSSRVTAIGVAAGAMMIDACSPENPVSALHLHGTLDTVVPLAGGGTAGILFPSASDSVAAFTRTGIATAELVTDESWSHEWQPEWTSLFAEFLATR